MLRLFFLKLLLQFQRESLEPAKVPSSAVTPEKTSESSQHVETVTTNETHKVENTTEAISTVEKKLT